MLKVHFYLYLLAEKEIFLKKNPQKTFKGHDKVSETHVNKIYPYSH